MTKTFRPSPRLCLITGAALFSVAGFVGCVYQDPGRPVGYRPAPVQATVVVQDDYVYYPQYEVYYSSSRHQYGYRDGNAWAWRPAPANVSLNVMLSSPSVRMDFHDSPERHHATVVKTYPKNWHAPAAKPGKDDHQKDRKDDGKDSNRGH